MTYTLANLEAFNASREAPRSPEWQAVYTAAATYLAQRTDTSRTAVIDAIQKWHTIKAQRGGSRKRGLDQITAIWAETQAEKQTLELTQAEDVAITRITETQQRLIGRAFIGARLIYRNGVKDSYGLKGAAEETASAWSELTSKWPALQAFASRAGRTFRPMTSAVGRAANSFSTAFSPVTKPIGHVVAVAKDRVASGASRAASTLTEAVSSQFNAQDLMNSLLLPEIRDIAAAEISRLLGQVLFEEIQNCIPYIGTFTEGVQLAKSTKELISTSMSAYEARKFRRGTADGAAAFAISALETMLKRDLEELGLEVACKGASFTCACISLAGTGTDVPAIAARAASATARLMATIYRACRDFNEMHAAQTILAGGLPIDHEALKACPFLGLQVIHLCSASDLVGLHIGEFSRANGVGSVGCNHDLDALLQRASALKQQAYEGVRESRFEFRYGPDRTALCTTIGQAVSSTLAEQVSVDESLHEHLEQLGVPEALAGEVSIDDMVGERLEELATFGGQDVRAYGNVAKAEKLRDIKENVLGPFAQAHVQKQAERAEAEHWERFHNSIDAILARRREVEAANVAALAALLRKMDDENRRIEAGQAQAAMNRERRARLEKIAAAVTQALNTYSDQTSGFRSLITSKSTESVQASEALRRMAAVASPDPALESTVRWLLGKGGSKPPALSMPLKPGSRLYGLLESAYAGT